MNEKKRLIDEMNQRLAEDDLQFFMTRVREGCRRIAQGRATAEQILDELYPSDEERRPPRRLRFDE